MRSKLNFFIFLLFLPLLNINAQKATIKEETLNMKTYMFSDPNPVPNIGRIYPYFRFDGYTADGVNQDWKMVILENKYIKVYVCPSVGGKIWGAIEKSTGKEFLYFNDVVKFRDVAMRGAWTSGGLEYNFGDIGHIPTCATPVDYTIKEHDNGSVSCIVGAIDLPSRTKWNVEITLPKESAYFETKVTWFNASSLPVTYYHWMNAAAKAKGDLEFIAPGNKRIGHGGEIGEWPIEKGRDISRYEKNNFGTYKSYHIVNGYADFFGGYWHDDNFGFGHYSTYDDKPGKKIWIWGLSDQGMIWEDLLTDTKGQYVEYQAGKLFNQAAASSANTPFKHREFSPYDTDLMNELWFPLKETEGMVAASKYAVLNVKRTNDNTQLFLSPLLPISSELKVCVGGKNILTESINLKPLELFTHELKLDANKDFTVELGDKLLFYNSSSKAHEVSRPLEPISNFNWDSAYGLYLKGFELEKQRRFKEAQESYQKSLVQEPSFLPSINRLALSHYRSSHYQKALDLIHKSLSIDTYDPLANHLFGLVSTQMDKTNDAKSGFSIAAQSPAYRASAYTELAKLYLRENELHKATKYAEKAMLFNGANITATEILSVIHRKNNDLKLASESLNRLSLMDATSHFVNFERFLYDPKKASSFQKQITNEFPFESYLELASKYIDYGAKGQALKVLNLAPEHVIVSLWKAHLDTENEGMHLNKALAMSSEMVFPHRKESMEILSQFITKNKHWKLKYYLALQQWNRGNIEAAKTLFEACGEEPNIVAFYLAKVELFEEGNEITKKSLSRANQINKEDWRLKLAWAQYFIRTNQLKSASLLTKKTFAKHPEKAIVGMLYARTLIQLKQYKTSLKFLEKFKVLPFEGATGGRALYHETSNRLSMDAFAKKNYKTAIAYAKKAKLWPKNLGVGKHFNVDERLNDYLIANAYEKLGDKKQAEIYYQQVAEFNTKELSNESSKLYFQLAALKALNKTDRLDELINYYNSKSEENVYLKWVLSNFNQTDANELRKEILNTKVVSQLYDTKFIDREFEMVSSIVGLLNP